jgi:ankyrin repeat protein
MATNRFSDEQLREFVIAGHWNLLKVKEMLAEFPEILNVSYQWGEDDWETAIQGAAHVGSVHVAEFLLAQGAPLEICTAAMLGRLPDVERMLAENPALINARGAHGIPLMAHAALSGNVQLAQALLEHGAHNEFSFALSNAVSKGYLGMARWLLENGNPDLSWKNYEGKDVLTIAIERGDTDIIALLRDFGSD